MYNLSCETQVDMSFKNFIPIKEEQEMSFPNHYLEYENLKSIFPW